VLLNPIIRFSNKFLMATGLDTQYYIGFEPETCYITLGGK